MRHAAALALLLPLAASAATLPADCWWTSPPGASSAPIESAAPGRRPGARRHVIGPAKPRVAKRTTTRPQARNLPRLPAAGSFACPPPVPPTLLERIAPPVRASIPPPAQRPPTDYDRPAFLEGQPWPVVPGEEERAALEDSLRQHRRKVHQVPEPGVLALLCTALGAAFASRRKGCR